jgi:hypothetical protein
VRRGSARFPKELRLLRTAMILEVSYRHLPIYGGQSIDDEFRE